MESVSTVFEFDVLPEFCVELIGDISIDVSVQFRTEDGTAMGG